MISTNKTSYAVGIDIGGSSLKCGVVNELGEILSFFLVPLKNAKTENEIINLIVSAILQCTDELKEPIVGVGIGFPGVIDNDEILGGGDNLPPFKELALGQTLKKLTGHNIVINNDANLMGLGELFFGAAKDCSDAIFLTVGTGIGGAIMIDKKLHGGYKNRGAELGHIVIQQNGLNCSCGGCGCLEAYASVSSLINYYKTQNTSLTEEVDGRYIIEKYHSGEKYAINTMKRHFDYLAAGIASYVNVFSPQKVVIGGGISEAGQFYIDELTRRTKALAIPVAIANLEIVAARLGNKAGLLGCCANVFQKFKSLNYAS